MSDEHAPLCLLRQVFGDDIISVMSDTGERADVRTAAFGDVRLIADAQGCMARVGDGDSRKADNMEDALRAAIVCRIDRARAEVRRMEREAVALNRLRVPVPE